VIVAAIFGCGLSRSRAGSASLPTISDLQPQANPGSKANLDYGGSVIPVDLMYSLSGSSESVDSKFQGELFEHEEYATGPTSYSLVATSDEQFAPPIPLLTDGQHQTNWTGTFSSAGVSHPATAVISVSVNSIAIGANKLPSVVSKVDLNIESGGPNAAKRTLTFTFLKGRGVVEREFSAGVKRLPVD
jgi:hypothetical protein